MTALFCDTNVLLHAVGSDGPHRAASRALIAVAEHGTVDLHVSVEAVQEFIHHRMRRSHRDEALDLAGRLTELCVLHPFDADVLRRSLDLISRSAIRGRDAVHAATALQAGFTSIVTTDRDFARVPALSVVSPAEALER
jgi:uncharacterized protein